MAHGYRLTGIVLAVGLGLAALTGWMRSRAESPEYRSQQAAFLRTEGPLPADLLKVADQIDQLIRSGQSTSADFGDGSPQPTTLWSNWRAEWTSAVQEVLESLPPRPNPVEAPRLSEAHDALTAALDSLKAVTHSSDGTLSDLPSSRLRSSRFEHARACLNTALVILGVLDLDGADS